MNDTQLIENYIFKRLDVENQLILEARLLIDTEFRGKLKWQRQAHDIIKAHGRNILRQEISLVEKRLFSEPRFKNFRTIIFTIFK